MGGIDQTPETSITRRLKSFSFLYLFMLAGCEILVRERQVWVLSVALLASS